MADFGSAFLLFAVIGHFALRTVANRTRFLSHAASFKWEQSVFESAAAGLVLFAACRLVVVPLAAAHPWLRFHAAPYLQHIHTYLPFSFSGSIIGTALLGLGVANLSNLLWREQAEIRRAIEKHGGELRVFLHDAARSGTPVSLTMKNRKVYVGLVLNAPRLSEPSYVKLLPTYSGYRDERTLKLDLTTPYEHVYRDLVKQKGEELEGSTARFVIILPFDNIDSANEFDMKIYTSHFAKKQPAKTGAAGAAP